MPGEEMRDWNRRSKGRNEGVGLLKPGREATEGSTLLPGEDMKEPYVMLEVSGAVIKCLVLPGWKANHPAQT